ncbi:MAG: NAD-dependent epimerase/dehydratase family protein [Myxococcota bacterium]
MRIVITGATGNLGTSLMRSLEMDSTVQRVVGLARRPPPMVTDKLRFVRTDVSIDDLEARFRGADAVVHLAWRVQPARDEALLYRANVTGSYRVLQAAARARVPALVCASSVGAYARGSKERRVDESWPVTGIPTSIYSRQKAILERMLDRLERECPRMRVVRARPALVFKRGAASGIRRYFLGPWVPGFIFRSSRIPVVPDVERLRFQVLHSHDAGEALRRMVLSDVHGAFNLAAEPVVDAMLLGTVLGARRVPVPARWLRVGVQWAYRLHLMPTHRGWVDLALGMPLMSTERAYRELGFEPRHSAADLLLELLEGIHDGAGMPTPPLWTEGGDPRAQPVRGSEVRRRNDLEGARLR